MVAVSGHHEVNITSVDKNDEPFAVKDIYIVGTLFILALVFRWPKLSSLDLWFDEVALLFQTKMSFVQIWTFCRDENFPPLYGWLLKAWGYIYTGDNWFRFLSTLLGAMIPPAAYILGREIHGRKLGLWLSLLLIISLPLIFYSQIIRMYSLWVLSACISYIALIRALKTDERKYWLIMAIANLIAFYTFLMTTIFVIAEFLVLVWHFRKNWRRYSRFLISHLPAFLLMALWGATLLQRYQKVSEYVTWHIHFGSFLDVWTYFGTGRAFEYDKVVTALLNLPLLVGLLVGISRWKKSPYVLDAAIILVFSGGAIAILSIIGHSMFFPRYLLFLLPLYILLALYGWLDSPRRNSRLLGLSLVSLSALAAIVVFYTHYTDINDVFRYEGQFKSVPGDDGRSISRIARTISDRLNPGEVIIHYTKSHVRMRTFSFFSSIYYHNRSLPEYIYSAQPVPIYCGGQYMHSGEQIRSLQDFESPPAGIWVITWDRPPEVLDYSSVESQSLRKRKYYWPEDLPLELYQAGYRVHELITDYSLSAIHFLPRDDSEPEK
jgi:uncharacterized membrane protein